MGSYKLGVEVINAYNLMPKEKGSSNPHVELEFNGQKFRTTVKEKELNPVWNERFFFNISDPSSIPNLSLEASIYSINTERNSRSFLGKVRLAGTSFVPSSDAAVMHYPLENNIFFSRVRGELGLKVFLTVDPSIKASNPLPAIDPATKIHPQKQVLNPKPNPARDRSGGPRRTFHSIGKEAHNQHEHCPPATVSEEPVKRDAGQFKCESPKAKCESPKFANMCSRAPSKKEAEYALKKTNPSLGFGQIVGGQVIHAEKPSTMYDLVEPMQYLFVRVVKAKDLPESTDPFTELKFGISKAATKQLEKKPNPEWNEVFAFSHECMHSTILEVQIKDKKQEKDEYIGRVRFNINDVPMRAPLDSQLAPEWYRLDDKKEEKIKGELMLAVWIGTQADEAFPDAWQSDVANAAADASVAASPHVRSKVYHAPRLWYVRVNIIEALDIEIADKDRTPEVFVKAQIGDQHFRTRKMKSRRSKYFWNEEIMFVAAEPFEDQLVLSVEDRVKLDKDEVIGRVTIPLFKVEKRPNGADADKPKKDAADGDKAKKDKPASRIHLRVFLEGGYHVLDESTQYSSDFRPSAKQLWKPAVGVLQVGILGATGLLPMKTKDGKGMTDAYCVAKYGKKWIRTRTMINSLCPRFNEQHTWEIYDPATVLTVGVFDNCQIGEKGNGKKDAKDSKDGKEGQDAVIGKIRIRLSTLETGRVYTHSYPLLVLQPSGLKKMGELHLAVRFSSTSFVGMMSMYARPLLPKMHYVRPLMLFQIDVLCHHAIQILAARLGRMEPPLRKEVVEFMSDVDCHLWSMRRSKANFFRLTSVFSRLFEAGKWFKAICTWTKPVASVLVHVLFTMLVCFPELILPTAFLYMSFIGLWNYRHRAQYPPHMNTKLSQAENADPDELDEEFDAFPTSKEAEVVKKRYDRLRCVAGKVQMLVGDVATQGERIQALISWRDPRATSVFVLLCSVAAAVAYVTPLRVVVALLGFYTMRHPRFRQKTPSAPATSSVGCQRE
uniref:C2 domain-containing protein n=1 Tax=Ananas comosus var. bracteatus TaxID=296719 RepID=A0A6V7PJL9_ANACO|nr:unnamed protein product [Ananas comosus var. bracteatus]